MVDGLAPGVEFAFRVRGVNRSGNGPWSRPVYATPKGEPTMARAPRPGFRTALTAQARGLLEEASGAIGQRLSSAGRAGGPLTALAGLFGVPGPGRCSLEDSLGACAAHDLGRPWPGNPGRAGGLEDLRDAVRSQGLAMSFGRSGADGAAAADDPQLTLWGDSASHGSGSLFLGMDADLGGRWMAGVAFAGSDGSSFWQDPESAVRLSGRVESEVFGVYPYVRGRLGRGVEVWSLAGWGTGTFDSRWSDAGPGLEGRRSGALDFNLGLVGAKRQLYERGGFHLSALVDGGWSTLTATGGETVFVHRTRAGLEGRHSSQDGSLTSMLRASARLDGGEDEARGLELAGSMRRVQGRYMAGLEGRWYEADATALEGLREQGIRATLALLPRADGTGFGAMLSPGWGTDVTGGAGLLDAFEEDDAAVSEPALRLDGRISWGERIRGGNLLRPYAEFSFVDDSSHRVRGGLALEEGPVHMGLAVERRGTAGTPAEHGIMLRLDARF